MEQNTVELKEKESNLKETCIDMMAEGERKWKKEGQKK